MGLFSAETIDQTSYLTFITEYKSTMYRIAFGYLCDETKAVDAVDEAVYLGYLHRKDLREAKFLKTWLTRILINECYKVLKRNKRELTTEQLPECSIDSLDSAAVAAALRLAVRELPEDLHKVITLRYFGGYTIAETAEILKIPEGTVATRTRKALGILKVEMSGWEGGDEDERPETTEGAGMECFNGESL